MSDTAETEVLQARGGGEVTLTVERDHLGREQFVITTDTGYRALLPSCPCAEENGGRRRCKHQVHIEDARAVAIEVSKTYGSAARRETAPPARRTLRRVPMSSREWEAARGLRDWSDV